MVYFVRYTLKLSKRRRTIVKELPRIMLLIEASRQAGRGMLIGISQYAKLHGPISFYRQLPFYQTFASANRREKGLARIIRQWHPDGIIIEAPSIKDPGDIIPQGTKAVFIPIRKLVPGFGNLVDDQGRCGRLGAEHFLDRGFVNLAYCGYEYIYWSQERSRAYCQRAQQAGLEVHMYHQPISKLRTWEKEMPYLISWLKALPKPVGIMVCNDDRAQFLIEACKTGGLHSPEDVAILGVGAIKKKPVVIETEQGDEIVIRQMGMLTLGFDHRLIDGAMGAAILEKIVQHLENFDFSEI